MQFALDGDKAAALGHARSYVEKALGGHLATVRRAMDALARSLPPEELNRVAFRLYEHLGMGAKDVLDLSRIENSR